MTQYFDCSSGLGIFGNIVMGVVFIIATPSANMAVVSGGGRSCVVCSWCTESLETHIGTLFGFFLGCYMSCFDGIYP